MFPITEEHGDCIKLELEEKNRQYNMNQTLDRGCKLLKKHTLLENIFTHN